MDPISTSFCGAKWWEVTMWLYQGGTASCHHNPFHQIELDPNDPSSLHNTPQKIREREAMLRGEKPRGCDYCWSIESSNEISDRYAKTRAVPVKILHQWLRDNKPLTADPYMIEVAFDRTCNLACAYCGPTFSSKWANEIKNHGPYIGLQTEGRYFTDSSEGVYRDDQENPYVEAFLKWLPKLEATLEWIRVTGGEPTMSPNFWRFLDRLQVGEFTKNLSINTNLVCKEEILQRLLSKLGSKYKTAIHTSIESNFQHTEYIRDGFERELWYKNVITILESPVEVVDRLNFTTSINNLGVWSMIDYLKMIGDLKMKYGKDRVELNCNFVHYPVFMRVQLIPYELRKTLAAEYQQWLDAHRDLCHPTELAHLERLITIMSQQEHSWETAPEKSRELAFKDIKLFIEQYDKRRKKNFRTALDPRFVSWYDSI